MWVWCDLIKNRMRLVCQDYWSWRRGLTDLGKIEVREFLHVIFLLLWVGECSVPHIPSIAIGMTVMVPV